MADEPTFDPSNLSALREEISLGISAEEYTAQVLAQHIGPRCRMNSPWPSTLEPRSRTYRRLAQINHSRKYAGRPPITEADLSLISHGLRFVLPSQDDFSDFDPWP
jgi:hypothetical protein